MLSQKDGPFIQVSRLNISKYAKITSIAKALFEYLFYYEGDIRNAMELAVQATQHCQFKDWWWKVQLAKCYIALNLIRDAEQQLRSALKQHYHVDTFIRLARVYLRMGKNICYIFVRIVYELSAYFFFWAKFLFLSLYLKLESLSNYLDCLKSFNAFLKYGFFLFNELIV